MEFISLFSGIGGLDLGLERAGMECVAQVEIDDYCQKVLTKHWPHVPKYKDVKDVGKNNLPAADLICGGFPCQPHSLAGSRKASIDARDLWPEFARIVRECQPEWVVAENVPGLLSSEAGRFFGRVLWDLAASGYGVEWQSLPAAAFGAPHIRERIFIVAHNESLRKRGLSTSTTREGEEVTDPHGVYPDVLPNLDRSRQYKQWFTLHASQTIQTIWSAIKPSSQWEIEPGVVRVVHGFPGRVDRLKGLGNAVVPQVAEFVGRCILNFDNQV